MNATTNVYFKRLTQAYRVDGIVNLLQERAKNNSAAKKKPVNSLILCTDIAQMQRLDELLWTISDDSFLAHAIATDNETQDVLQPILLTTSIVHSNAAQVLINATEEVPTDMNGFSSIVDFTDEWDEHLLLAARARFRLYKQIGFHMQVV